MSKSGNDDSVEISDGCTSKTNSTDDSNHEFIEVIECLSPEICKSPSSLSSNNSTSNAPESSDSEIILIDDLSTSSSKESFESYKSFTAIENDFKIVDALAPANPANLDWELLAINCAKFNLDSLDLNGYGESFSLLVIREKLSKKLGVNIPDHVLLDFLKTKCVLNNNKQLEPKESDTKADSDDEEFKPYTVSKDIIDLADVVLKERGSRIIECSSSVPNEQTSPATNIHETPIIDCMAATNDFRLENIPSSSSGSQQIITIDDLDESIGTHVSSTSLCPIDFQGANFSFDSELSSSNGNMNEFPTICYIVNEGTSTVVRKGENIFDQTKEQESTSNNSNVGASTSDSPAFVPHQNFQNCYQS